MKIEDLSVLQSFSLAENDGEFSRIDRAEYTKNFIGDMVPAISSDGTLYLFRPETEVKVAEEAKQEDHCDCGDPFCYMNS